MTVETLPDVVPDFVPPEWVDIERKRLCASLARHAARIVDNGWHQGDWSHGDAVCAMRALTIAMHMRGVFGYQNSVLWSKMHERAKEVIYRTYGPATRETHVSYHGEIPDTVPAWNDHPKRTKAEVVAMWNAVAESFAA